MKRLIILLLAFLSLNASAQTAIKRPIAGRITQASTGPTFIQSIGVNFSTNETVANWNTIYPGNENVANLKNLLNVSTGIALVYTTTDTDPAFSPESQGTQTDPNGYFPSSVLQYMVYRGGFANQPTRDQIAVRFTGIDNTKTYRIRCAAVQGYNDANDETQVIINGTSYDLGGPNLANTVYPTTNTFFPVTVTGTTIDVVFQAKNVAAAGYACINAMILEQYTP